jgi:hypothetical protein
MNNRRRTETTRPRKNHCNISAESSNENKMSYRRRTARLLPAGGKAVAV